MTSFEDDTILISDRLILTPLRPEDADEMMIVLADERLYEFIGGRPLTLEELRARYHRLAAGSSRPDETWLNWIVRRSSDSQAVGTALLRWPWRHDISETPAMRSLRHHHPRPAPSSAFAAYLFPPEVITLAVRWYLRFGLSYRDVEELLAERGIEVDHVTVYRWVQRFAPEFAEAARARQHVIGDRWHVDETYLRLGGTWRYLFRDIDQFGQIIDVFVSSRRNKEAARRFFDRAMGRTRVSPAEVTSDRYRVYPRVLDEVLPAAFHDTEVHANNPIETDHGRLKARLRPMRGLKRDRTARVIVSGHAFVQNLRRGFYDLGTDVLTAFRLADAFSELALVI